MNSCCSLCKEVGHNITTCSSREIVLAKQNIDTNIIKIQREFMERPNLRDQLIENADDIKSEIENKLKNVLNIFNKPVIYALIHKHILHFGIIETELNLTLKLKRKEIEEIFIKNHTELIVDLLHLYYNQIIGKVRYFYTKRFFKILTHFTVTENIGLDIYHLYSQFTRLTLYGKVNIKENVLYTMNYIQWIYRFSQLPENIKNVFLVLRNRIVASIEEKNILLKINCVFNENQTVPSEETDCAICLEKYESRIKLNCNHLFCSDCVIKTIESNYKNKKKSPCPLCREIIQDVETNSFNTHYKLNHMFSQVVG